MLKLCAEKFIFRFNTTLSLSFFLSLSLSQYIYIYIYIYIYKHILRHFNDTHWNHTWIAEKNTYRKTQQVLEFWGWNWIDVDIYVHIKQFVISPMFCWYVIQYKHKQKQTSKKKKKKKVKMLDLLVKLAKAFYLQTQSSD